MEVMVTTGCAMKKTVIITFEKLFNSDNRFNMFMVFSLLTFVRVSQFRILFGHVTLRFIHTVTVCVAPRCVAWRGAVTHGATRHRKTPRRIRRKWTLRTPNRLVSIVTTVLEHRSPSRQRHNNAKFLVVSNHFWLIPMLPYGNGWPLISDHLNYSCATLLKPGTWHRKHSITIFFRPFQMGCREREGRSNDIPSIRL